MGRMTREEAIKGLKVLAKDFSGYRPNEEMFNMAIEALEQPEQGWIPCSERLPDSMGWDKRYLVSLAWGGVGAMEYKSTGFHNYGSLSPVSIETVIAWMPLPEPYRKDGETNE